MSYEESELTIMEKSRGEGGRIHPNQPFFSIVVSISSIENVIPTISIIRQVGILYPDVLLIHFYKIFYTRS